MKNALIILALCSSIGIDAASHKRKKKQQRETTETADLSACAKVAKKTLDLTNQFRKKKGLSPLAWNQKIADIARDHSRDMGNRKVEFGHDGFKNRVNKFPFSYKSSAENVYMGNYSGDIAQIAVDAWIDSPGHLKNLVGDFDTCGIGVYQNAEGYWYFTQLFALPMNKHQGHDEF